MAVKSANATNVLKNNAECFAKMDLLLTKMDAKNVNAINVL